MPGNRRVGEVLARYGTENPGLSPHLRIARFLSKRNSKETWIYTSRPRVLYLQQQFSPSGTSRRGGFNAASLLIGEYDEIHAWEKAHEDRTHYRCRNGSMMLLPGILWAMRALIAPLSQHSQGQGRAICVARWDGRLLTQGLDARPTSPNTRRSCSAAFWSLTMGTSRNRFVQNPINRYSASDRSNLLPNADASIDIYIQTGAPVGRESNWLPAPMGKFILWLRVYQPGEAILEGKYRVPPVVKAKIP